MKDSNRNPEQRARQPIDERLCAAGWIIQNNADFNRNAGEGVAVQEFSRARECEQLCFPKKPGQYPNRMILNRLI